MAPDAPTGRGSFIRGRFVPGAGWGIFRGRHRVCGLVVSPAKDGPAECDRAIPRKEFAMSGPGSLAASFVMTVPLVAVPMLAVFGLPSLGARHVEAETDPAVEFQAPPPPEPVVPRSVPKSITRDGAEAFGPASGSTPMASAPECPSDGFGVADRSQFDPHRRPPRPGRPFGRQRDGEPAGCRFALRVRDRADGVRPGGRCRPDPARRRSMVPPRPTAPPP